MLFCQYGKVPDIDNFELCYGMYRTYLFVLSLCSNLSSGRGRRKESRYHIQCGTRSYDIPLQKYTCRVYNYVKLFSLSELFVFCILKQTACFATCVN